MLTMHQKFKLQAQLATIVFSLLASIAFLRHILHLPYNSTNDEVFSTPMGLPDRPPIGIGFDLTAFYGTVVLSFPNGSTINVAKVEANSLYQETMKTLSLESSKHFSPPYSNQGE